MYKLTQVDHLVFKIDEQLWIPTDPNNGHYQKYLKWLDGYEIVGREWVKTSDGNQPLPADGE
jgi:hypothetical protein